MNRRSTERRASAAAGSGSAADAGGRQLHALVRRGLWHRHWDSLLLAMSRNER